MSVLVCIPTDRDIHSRTIEAVLAICSNHSDGASFRSVRAHPTDRCRNICVRAFLETPHSHLFFVDSDVVPPHDCLQTMLDAKREIVCGIYPLQLEDDLCTSVARKMGPDTYGFLNDCPAEPFEIDNSGLGCALIAREVFERVEDPWFKFVERSDGHLTGEDIYFFEKCAKEGIRPLVLPQILCSHHRTVGLLKLYLKHCNKQPTADLAQVN